MNGSSGFFVVLLRSRRPSSFQPLGLIVAVFLRSVVFLCAAAVFVMEEKPGRFAVTPVPVELLRTIVLTADAYDFGFWVPSLGGVS